MSFEKFLFFFCLVVCVGCLFGIYRLQAQPQRSGELGVPTQERPETTEDSETRGTLFSESIESDFYQTIIKNNLFAPLGTVLNQKRVPGANLKLLGTFVSKDAVHSTAIIKNETTGRQEMLSIGGGLGDFQVVEIQCQQVTLDHLGSSVVLRLPSGVLLNAQRR